MISSVRQAFRPSFFESLRVLFCSLSGWTKVSQTTQPAEVEMGRQLVLVFFVLLAAVLQDVASQSYCTNAYGYSQYCTYGCCGYYSSDPCCNSYNRYYDNDWGVVTYVSTGIASGTALLITIIISATCCCIYGCCKKYGKAIPQVHVVGGTGATKVLEV